MSDSKGLKMFSQMRISTTELLTETVQFLRDKYKQARSVFTSASPFGQVLLVLHNLVQLIFYYIEDSITELNINEATRPTSVYSLASLSGHNPSRAVSAFGEVVIVPKVGLTEVPSGKVILANYTQLRCLNNGLPYVMDLPQDEVRVALTGSGSTLRASIRQGSIESQTLYSDGTEFQSFQIGYPNNFFIDNFLVNVYVNGEKWTKYESILDVPRKAKGFVTKTGVINGLDLFLGGGSFGTVPPAGAEIIIEYLITAGSPGTINAEDPSQIRFDFEDSGFTFLGEEINMNDYVDVIVSSAPNFGVDPENLKLTRMLAPKVSKSFALVNETSYELMLRKMQMFSTVKVFLDDSDNRIINLFLVPDTRRFYDNGTDYFKLDLSKFTLSRFQKAELQKYIEKSGTKMLGTEIRIIDPVIRRYVLNISVIVFNDIPEETIKAEILDKIGEYFISITRKDRVPKSDIIKIIEEIRGVDSVSVNIISEENEKAKSENPNSLDVGLDSFNDIVLSDNEFPIIRGGWNDRFGNEYAQSTSEDSLGCINIQIKDRVKRSK